MKRNTILIIVFWLCISITEAQKITEKHIDFSGKESLSLNIQITDSITLHTWNKDEVYITSSVNINNNKDNDAYIISFDEKGSNIEVNAKFKDDYFKGRDNCCNESDISWLVYIPAKIFFEIETINGNITIDGETEMMKIKTISGFIDLAVPVSKKADIDFSTISGTIYSNHELALKEEHTNVPTEIKEELNNGGPSIKLETISGDIYFRKSE